MCDEAEALPLSKHGGFVVNRPILEMKYEPGRDLIAARRLYQLAVSQGSATKCLQDDEGVK
jgi:hypothetical protein